MEDRKTITYITQAVVPYMVRPGFNSIMFNNQGAVVASINNLFVLNPGESYGWSHNANEVNTGDYRIDFPLGNVKANVIITATYYND